MQPSQSPDESPDAVPADIRARVMPAVLDELNTLAAVQLVLAPLNIRALYSDAAVDDDYCAAIADMAWHALARKYTRAPVNPVKRA
jgi:hypothetical protein